MLVIGDLHGDYYRLKRILEENQISRIIENGDDIELEIIDYQTFVVFVGDYIDWRGEELENPLNLKYSDMIKGTSKIVNLVSKMLEKRENVFTLIGNHEEMMFRALKIVEGLNIDEIGEMFEKISRNPYSVMKEVAERGILEQFLSFYNWYSQGGLNTIRSFGNIENLIEIVQQRRLFKNLLLFVYFDTVEGDRIMISHSFPDDTTCIDRIIQESITPKDIQLLLWSRRIWGIDAFNGVRTEPLREEEIISVLDKNRIKHYIVGHTRVSLEPKPFVYLNGRVINVDNHGIPQSQPLIIKDIKISGFRSSLYNL